MGVLKKFFEVGDSTTIIVANVEVVVVARVLEEEENDAKELTTYVDVLTGEEAEPGSS